MYYFKDHLNFTNNLQDNLYILRQRQLKEAVAWSPSSGGPAIPESAAGNNELKDRMRNIKQSGDRQQSKEYLEMEAELKRREGAASAPKATLDPSFKPAPQSSASDWRTNYDNTRALVTQDGRIIQMDKFEGQRGNIGRSGVDLVKPAVSDITRERTVVVGNPGSERLVGLVDTKDGKSWVDPRDRQSAEERVKPSKPKTTVPASSPPPTPYSERGDGLVTPKVTSPTATQSSPSTAAKPESTMPGLDPTEPPYFGTDVTNMASGQPYVVPGSQDWNNMSHAEQHAMAARAITNNETHKFTGGRNAVDPNSPTGERARFSTDSGEGGPFAADTNERSKIANAVLEKQRQDKNRAVITNWNRSDIADTAVTPNRPWFWPKPSNNIPDTGADAGGYGPPKPSNNIPDTGADAGGYGPPKPKADPVSVVPPSSSPRAGGRPMVMYDMDGIPVSVTPPTPKPSTEYSTDIIDQGKIIMGQESVNDILDRMRNPKENTSLDWKETLRKEVDDKYNKKMGSDWARNRFSLKNYFELRRNGAAAYARAKEDYKTASSKPSWAK